MLRWDAPWQARRLRGANKFAPTFPYHGMTHYDVFNGDADGICALHQLRLEAPRESTLVTGVKRDIALLGRVDAQSGDSVTALDISLATNLQALVALLDRGVRV